MVGLGDLMIENTLYIEDVKFVAELDLPWNQLKNKTILLTGATGLLGTFFVDVVMYRNIYFDLGCKLLLIGRNIDKAKQRFEKYWNSGFLIFYTHDINLPLEINEQKINFVMHLASNTHPLQYANEPISTITTNIIGLKNMLDLAVDHNIERFVFASSNEIYGENRGDVELFDENYCGYINSNTLRAGYPESKRCGEALCQAYIKQYNMDIVIPRFTRSYGPTMRMNDTKAISQFIKNGIKGENIVLKSEGNQYYSYTYVSDAISGLFTILFYGKNGEAYNIADEESDIKLKDLASLIAKDVNTKVIFQLPDDIEKSGYSKATKARLNGNKLKQLGWKPKYSIQEGIVRNINIIKSISFKEYSDEA